MKYKKEQWIPNAPGSDRGKWLLIGYVDKIDTKPGKQPDGSYFYYTLVLDHAAK